MPPIAKTAEKIQQVGRIIAADPDVTEVHFNLGSSAPNQAGFNAALIIRGDGAHRHAPIKSSRGCARSWRAWSGRPRC